MTSARMNPRARSVWMRPAAACAFCPRRIVQARVSFGPVVKNGIRSSSAYAASVTRSSADASIPRSCRKAAASASGSSRELGLDLGVHGDARGAALGGERLDRGRLLGVARVVDVREVERRLGRQEVERRGHVDAGRSGGPAGLEPVARSALQASTSATASRSPPLAVLATRSCRRSIAARSANASSSSTVSTSSSGSTLPGGMGDGLVAEAPYDVDHRVGRPDLAQELVARGPRRATRRGRDRRCRPPRSVAGTILAESESRASVRQARVAHLGLGAVSVSTVENMCGATAAPPPVSALKTVDLPLFGRPTRPTSRLAIRPPPRPRR